MTNVAAPGGSSAPLGQLARMRAYPTAAFRAVVSPNADTLYVSGWMDVSKEPMVLTLPATHDRYTLFPMLDGWTNVFRSPGMRTTGTGQQTYAITGPHWSGKLPAGVKEYKSPTALVWMIGRVYCTGTKADLAASHAIQDGVKLVPLSAYGKPYAPAPHAVDPNIVMNVPPVKQVNAMDGIAFFTLFAKLLSQNPPLPADGPMIAKLATIGIVPGRPFEPSALNPAVRAAISAAPKTGQAQMLAYGPSLSKSSMAGAYFPDSVITARTTCCAASSPSTISGLTSTQTPSIRRLQNRLTERRNTSCILLKVCCLR